MTSLGAKRYHLGCLAAPVNRARQHNNKKTHQKKEKSNCQSITTSELISHKLNKFYNATREKSFVKGVAAE